MSETLILQPSAASHWQQLLQQAEEKCHCRLDDEVESYLIFTLMRFTQNQELASAALAADFLQTLQLAGHAREQRLRDLGDQCLLLTGLFPQRAERRLVRVSYYVDLGRSAYDNLSHILRQAFAQLYRQLARNFVQLMDVLQNIRSEPALQPLQAFELWADTASDNALRIVSAASDATPIIDRQAKRH
jgi:hypothetical protein